MKVLLLMMLCLPLHPSTWQPSECCTLEVGELAARGCTGGLCSACKNCSGCAHCAKKGGSCSVCRPAAARPTPPPAPAPSQPPPSQPVPREPPAQRPNPEQAKSQPAAENAVEFTPKPGPLASIAREVRDAKSKVRILSSEFGSSVIARALTELGSAGRVEVVVLVDSRVEKPASAFEGLPKVESIKLLGCGGDRPVSSNFILIDERLVIISSSGFTPSAEQNQIGQMLFITDEELIQAFIARFDSLRKESLPLAAR